MKLSLHKPFRDNGKLKVICIPLLLSFASTEAIFATNLERERLSLETNAVSRFVNITGTVKDNKGEPLPGVAVKIKGTNTGTVTDVNGVFRINLPTGNETLVISYLGFNSQEIAVAGRTQLNIVLEESTSTLDEIVVTGYGEKKRSELVGSVATISGEELMDIPSSNIAGAMRNRIAGVSVSEASGRPGASITLNIRNSTTNTLVAGATAEPLYVIDGITVEKDAFDNLDASMIESLTFLKDASAAIYGAAGAKGVVLVTTKRGKVGKPSISYNGYLGVSDATRKPELLSAYELGVLLNETNRMANAPQSSFFSEGDLEQMKNMDYNWFDQLWKSSTTQRHNISISGGSDKITFFVGGSYQNENGNYAGMKQDKYGFRSGVTATILEGLKADLAFNVDHRIRESDNGVTDGSDSYFEALVSVPRWVPLEIGGLPVHYERGALRNPLGIIQSGYYDVRKSQGYRVNASLTYQPKFLSGLTAKFQISQGGTNSNSTEYRPPFNLYRFQPAGNNGLLFSDQPATSNHVFEAVTKSDSRLIPGLGRSNSYQGFFTLQYAKAFGVHSFDIVAGGEQTENNSEALSVLWSNQLIPSADDYWAFEPSRLQLNGRSIFESTKRSFFGRFNYDFDKKYLVEAVARLDASSNFAKGDRWGLSPSIGLGWVVSKEDFFKDNISFVNFFKIKLNYGVAGDDRVQERLWQERYTIDVSNGYLFGSTNGNGLNPATFPNPSITWEKKKTFNAGVEMSLLNNKVDIGIEVFRNKTYDGFDKGGDNMYPYYVGFTSPVINYREYYNWGSEFTIGYKGKIAREINFNSSINFGYGNSVVNKMIYAPGNLRIDGAYDLNNWLALQFGTDPRKWNSGNVGYVTDGMFRTQEDVDAMLAINPNYKINGNIPQPGWIRYVDTNGDGVISAADMVPLFDNPNPILSSGISLGLGYKAFNLSTNIFARFGGKLFFDSQATQKPANNRNVLSFWRDRWTPDNPMSGRFPRFDDPYISSRSDFWAVDATTIRVNNMTLSYRLPAKLAAKMGLGSARILATGNNLWTIVNPYKYKDPYSSNAYNYPVLRTVSMGLSVNL